MSNPGSRRRHSSGPAKVGSPNHRAVSLRVSDGPGAAAVVSYVIRPSRDGHQDDPVQLGELIATT